MPLITFFINRILEEKKIDKNIILSYQCLNTIDNLDNDVKSYYYLKTNVDCGVIDTSENLLDLYLSAKKMSNGFIKLVRHYKWRKARVYDWDSDLYMVHKLDELPKRHVVSILSNKTIYRFKISDIINIWTASLLHRQGLFSEPEHPKNPHTNQIFKMHDLYNLYFGICNTYYQVPLDIGAVFRVNFNLKVFKRYYFPLLRERIILLYYKEATPYEIYEYIMTMLKKLKDEVGDVYIPHFPTRREQTNIIARMKHFVLLYLRATLSCNPEVRSENRDTLVTELKDFVEEEENDDIIYRIRRRDRTTTMTNSRVRYTYSTLPTTTPTLPPPPPLVNEIPQRLSLPAITLPPPPPVLDMTRFATNTNMNLSHIRNRLSHNAIQRNRITNRLHLNINESVAFRPRNELPRTPTNNSISNADSIVNTYRSSLYSSGILRNRMRFR